MKRTLKILTTLLIVSAIGLHSCKTVDLPTTKVKDNPEGIDLEKRGKELLTEANLAMGYDKLASTEVFEAIAHFKWRGALLVMPMNSLPGNNQKDIHFRFATNTFDGQVEYLEGRKQRHIYGLQSWKGYHTKDKSKAVEASQSARYSWGLATYHYLLEAPQRLLNAEIIRYAGERELYGKQYDLVFVSWGSEAPNKTHDQWLLYINKETKFIDLTELTISDFFVPMPKGLQHGSVWFPSREETSIGAHLPTEVVVQLGKPKAQHRGVYRFKLRDYKFDSFDKQLLYPLEGVVPIGDAKPFVQE